MVMSFTIRYCDIELEHYLQILVNKYEKFAQGIAGSLRYASSNYFSNIIDKQIYYTLKLSVMLVGKQEKNFEVVFSKL